MLKEYFSIAEILELRLEGYLSRYNLEVKANQEKWLFRVAKSTTNPYREYHMSNFPSVVREKIVTKLLERAVKEARNNGKNIEFVQESLKIAYSRLEIILFIKNSNLSISKFCAIYNGRNFLNNEISAITYENVPSVGERTLYRWIKAYDIQGLEGLKYKADERRLGRTKFEEAEDVNIKQLIIGALLNKSHLKVKLIYKFLIELGKKKNIKIPSYRWVCRVVEDYKKNNKQEFLLARNPDKWKSKYLLAIGSYSDGITEPNQLWELDSSPADIMLEGGRYMILACIDVYSRRVKFLVNKTSNSLGITSLLRACMLEWGIPKAIKTDNGKDYVSQQIKIVLNEFGVEHKLANPFQGQEKPQKGST